MNKQPKIKKPKDPHRALATVFPPAVTPVARRQLSFGDRWAYAPAPEASSHIKIQSRYGHYINGQFVQPNSGEYFPSVNPATEERLTEIARGDDHDIDRAVAAARKAYQGVWKKTTPRERGKYLFRIARLI